MSAPIQLQNGKLRDSDTKAYWDDGYLFPIPVIPTKDAVAWRAELEAI